MQRRLRAYIKGFRKHVRKQKEADIGGKEKKADSRKR